MTQETGGMDTREKIKNAARTLFDQGGIEALTMRAVAREADIGTMTTYRHFPNRDAVLAYLISHGFRLFAGYFERVLRADTAHEKVWLTMVYYLQFAQDHPRYYHLMFIYEQPIGALPLEREDRRHITLAMEFLLQRIADARGRDAFNDEDRRDAIRMWGLAHGLISLHLASRYDANMEFEPMFRDSMKLYFQAMGLWNDEVQA